MDKKETILITGVDGFLGYNLLKSLSFNYIIVGIERDGHNFNRINTGKLNKTVNLFYESEIEKVFNNINIDYVIHTATHHGKTFKSFKEVFDTNVDFGLKLLNLSDFSNINHFINIDTVLPKHLNIYSYTKNVFSESLEFIAPKIKTKIINIKMDMIYGYNSGNHNFIQKMLNQLQENISSIKVTKGEQERSFLYIKDIIKAIELLIIKRNILPPNPFVNFYLVNTRLERIKDVLITLKRMTRSSAELKFGTLEYRKNEIMKTEADYTFHRLFNWEPRYSFEMGIDDILKKKTE